MPPWKTVCTIDFAQCLTGQANDWECPRLLHWVCLSGINAHAKVVQQRYGIPSHGYMCDCESSHSVISGGTLKCCMSSTRQMLCQVTLLTVRFWTNDTMGWLEIKSGSKSQWLEHAPYFWPRVNECGYTSGCMIGLSWVARWWRIHWTTAQVS